tara:strand:- start:20320 stop:21936 length:1617 start_codon:yes stop_codon:yes gene_type:complete
MKIALCQVNPTVGSFENNKNIILKYYNRCKLLNANIVVFPELISTGYPPQDLLLDDGFIEENLFLVESIAAQSTIPLIMGYVRKENGKIFNSAVLCYNGKLQNTADKILLPTYDVFDEYRYFTAGNNPCTWDIPLETGVLRIGIQICEDLWDSNYSTKVSQIQKEKGAEILINISASPYHEDRLKERTNLIIEKAIKTGLPFLYCNIVGAQDELIFDGQSLAFNSKGNCLAQGRGFGEDMLMIDLNFDKPKPLNILPNEENVYKALCLGVSDYFEKTGHGEAVIGLSGGIDSTLVACIAVDALGADHVHGISMPSKFSSSHSLSDAEELANNLDIDYRILPINDPVAGIEKILEPQFLGMDIDITEENIQARIRGNLLMALSNKFGWMVLSTGNKTELALGYCTLYGDMSGGLAVISDLSKSDVYKLSRWINTETPNRIPVNCIKKLPSAELAPKQVDPFDYSIVSPLVNAIIEDRKSPAELIKNGADPVLVNDLYKRIRIYEYKRRQSAPGLRVSTKAFGFGRRIPIVNHYLGKQKL